jgi:hypothetical protein
MPWDLFGNSIAGGNFLGSTNAQPVEIRSNQAARLIIGTSDPIVRVLGPNNWHQVMGNIIVGTIPITFPISPFSGNGEIRAKSISATSDPGHPAPGPAAIGEITAQLITATRLVAPPPLMDAAV